jgi:serine/threonine protein kinase
LIGAGFTRSPEATFQISWTTATDIWSFGVAVLPSCLTIPSVLANSHKILDLLFGGRYHIFNPGVEGIDSNDDGYEFTVLKRIYKFFGPFPQSFSDFNDPDTMTIINFFNKQGPPEKPFPRVGPREIPDADKAFILRVMKLDPRDRPTAEDLLADEWFTEESPDTREPLPEKHLDGLDLDLEK